jgi:large subunit ribosomal protein L23
MNTLSSIIKRPRITEKASAKAEGNVYVFDVATDVNKKNIAAAVKALYNVTPVKVAIVKVPSKAVFVRGKQGVKQGGKKAYIYLKKGETIEFV